MFCHKCGNTIPNDAIFCNICGTRTLTSSPGNPAAPTPGRVTIEFEKTGSLEAGPTPTGNMMPAPPLMRFDSKPQNPPMGSGSQYPPMGSNPNNPPIPPTQFSSSPQYPPMGSNSNNPLI